MDDGSREENDNNQSKSAEEHVTSTFSGILRNVFLLSICFGIGWAMLFVQVSATTSLARKIAGTTFSLIPYGILATTHAIAALPAQLFMRRVGERHSYMFGAAMGLIGNVICFIASIRGSVLLLCLAGPFCGIANAYFNFLRFEAVRFVPKRHIGIAVSAVVTGGVVGGGIGPVLSRFTRTVLPHEFEATYLVSMFLWLLYIICIPAVQWQKLQVKSHDSIETDDQRQTGGSTGDESSKHVARSLLQIICQPAYFVSLLAGATSYSVMATLMLAASQAMISVSSGDGKVDFDLRDGKYSFDDVANAILIHVEAMFLPSFFTGYFMALIGPTLATVLGLSCLMAGTLMFLCGTHLWVFFLSIAMVGVGWNWSYVAATTLITSTYHHDEKDRAQGFNDCAIFALNAVMTTTAGTILEAMDSWPLFVSVYAGLVVPSLLLTVLFWLLQSKAVSNEKVIVPSADE